MKHKKRINIKKPSFSILFVFLYLLGHSQDGTNDFSFNTYDDGVNPWSGFNRSIHSTSLTSNDGILVGGDFNVVNASEWTRIALLTPNGDVDSTFNPGSGFNRIVHCTAIQSDGKFIVGGDFNFYNGAVRSGIARLNPNGGLDESFNIDYGFNNTVFSTIIDENGKVIVGGKFTAFGGQTFNRIARLKSNGSIDNSFDSGSGFNNSVKCMSLDLDGRLIVGGRFTSYNGTACNRIVRINQDGSIDNSFEIGTGFNWMVSSVFIQPNGKILVGGDFNEFNGVIANKIIRLNSDGSIDNSFNTGSGFDRFVSSISMQSDNKILVGGDFNKYNDIDMRKFIRLNNDGGIDNLFDIGSGFGDWVYCMSIQNDGKIVVGGHFYSFNGIHRNHIARLNVNTLEVKNENFEDLIQIYPNPTTDKVTLNVPNKLIGEKVYVYNSLGQSIDQLQIDNSIVKINLERHDKGTYFIRMNTENGSMTKRVIKH